MERSRTAARPRTVRSLRAAYKAAVELQHHLAQVASKDSSMSGFYEAAIRFKHDVERALNRAEGCQS